MHGEIKTKRIGVLMGGRSAERAVSLETGQCVLEALQARGFQTIAIDLKDTEVCASIDRASMDVCFIALHGRWGEDGCIQGFLESIGMPYTGAGVLASALAMDKLLSKQLLRSAGVATPDWRFPATPASVDELGLPLVLKPRAEGSSVGVTIATSTEDAIASIAAASGPLMAERYIGGRELSVAVVGHGDSVRCLGSIEIVPENGWYDYKAKYESDTTRYVTPPEAPAEVIEAMQAAAVAAHRLLGCAGATRSDFRWDESAGEEPQFIEINTLPGMTGHSLLPKIAAKIGIDYGELVELIIADAGLRA